MAVQIKNSWLKLRCLEVLVRVKTKCALPWLAEYSRRQGDTRDTLQPGGFLSKWRTGTLKELIWSIHQSTNSKQHFSKLHLVQPHLFTKMVSLCHWISWLETDFCLPKHCWTVLISWHRPVIYPKRVGPGALHKLHKTICDILSVRERFFVPTKAEASFLWMDEAESKFDTWTQKSSLSTSFDYFNIFQLWNHA